ncbi:MAG: BrnT family toxin [Arcobacteraceae bacterium]
MDFEFDINKSYGNQQKHGIDFLEAQKLWHNQYSVIVPAKNIEDEPRYAIIGFIDEKCWVGIFTIRHFQYRIISVRRCRKNEESQYESK